MLIDDEEEEEVHTAIPQVHNSPKVVLENLLSV